MQQQKNSTTGEKKNQTISISLEDVILTTTEEFYPLYISTQFDCAWLVY